jgi:hypothetical protein
VVDPWDWLDPDGGIPNQPRLRRQIIRVARLIEYAGLLEPGEIQETLVECFRPGGEPKCNGLLWVTKDPDDKLWAACDKCNNDVVVINNWQGTKWANGPALATTRTKLSTKNEVH